MKKMFLLLVLLIAVELAPASAQIYVVQNMTYTTQTVTGPTVTNEKIGSFRILNATTDTIVVCNIISGLEADSFHVLFSNLRFRGYGYGRYYGTAYAVPDCYDTIGITTGITPVSNLTWSQFRITPNTYVSMDVFGDLLKTSSTPTSFKTKIKVLYLRGTTMTPGETTFVNGQLIRLN
ncbi:MAG: hypothetical protein WCG55_00790 [bacterium]